MLHTPKKWVKGGGERQGCPRQPQVLSPFAPAAPLPLSFSPPSRAPLPRCQRKGRRGRARDCRGGFNEPQPPPFPSPCRVAPRALVFFPPQLDGFGVPASALESAAGSAKLGFSEDVVRTSEYMTHPVFNTHHSEVWGGREREREPDGTHACLNEVVGGETKSSRPKWYCAAAFIAPQLLLRRNRLCVFIYLVASAGPVDAARQRTGPDAVMSQVCFLRCCRTAIGLVLRCSEQTQTHVVGLFSLLLFC